MSKNRRHFSDEFKANVVRRHLAERVPVSDLAAELEVQPSLIHLWGQAGARSSREGPSAFQGPAQAPRERRAGAADRSAAGEAGEEERGDRRTDGGERYGKKSQWGTLKGRWVPHDVRDQIVDYLNHWSGRTELPVRQLLGWLELGTSKFHTWKSRYGLANEHNGQIPRDHWLEDWERRAILEFHDRYPLEGYRRLTFMMLDDDVVAVSPSTTYRVLKAAGRLDRHHWAPSKKGTGFVQPDGPHRHWHIDISHLNLGGTFYFLITVLDGYSRYIVHWEIRPSAKELDVELVLQRALEKHPGATPRIISDNGSQFIARDFKAFIRIQGLTHARTAPYYPQSNGKLERWHASVKAECVRTCCPETLEEARRKVADYVDYYNHTRLHSAIEYVTPADKLAGLEKEICAERDRKLQEARARRQAARSAA